MQVCQEPEEVDPDKVETEAMAGISLGEVAEEAEPAARMASHPHRPLKAYALLADLEEAEGSMVLDLPEALAVDRSWDIPEGPLALRRHTIAAEAEAARAHSVTEVTAGITEGAERKARDPEPAEEAAPERISVGPETAATETKE